MLLSQLVENSKLIIDIKINNENLEFKSVVVAKISDYVLIESIRIKGKVVNFETDNVLIDMLLIRNDKAPIIWKRVLLKNITYKSKTYYKVISTGNGFEINRRTAFRMYIGINGVVQVGVNSPAVDVIVKDVSETGFSFVSKENIDKSLKSTVRLVFADNNKTFCLSGILIRQEEINEIKYVYGCMLNIKNQILNQYINQKQREMLSRQGDFFKQKQQTSMKGIQAKEKRDSEIREKVKLQKRNPELVKSKTIGDVMKAERRNIFNKY